MISLSVKVSANLNSVELPARVRSEALSNAADQVADSLRENFYRMPGRNFWGNAGDSVDVQPGVPGQSLAVVVTQRGVRLQWLGLDPNTPKRASLLAIPASKAITEYPRAYPNLLPIFPRNIHWPKLRGWLVQGEQGTAKRKYKDRPAGRPIMRAVLRGGRPLIVFSLVTHTSHVPHPQVIPPLAKLNEVTKAAFRETLNQHFHHHA